MRKRERAKKSDKNYQFYTKERTPFLYTNYVVVKSTIKRNQRHIQALHKNVMIIGNCFSRDILCSSRKKKAQNTRMNYDAKHSFLTEKKNSMLQAYLNKKKL